MHHFRSDKKLSWCWQSRATPWHRIYIIGSDDAWPSYCVFSVFKSRPYVRHLEFSYFRNFCEKFKFAPISLIVVVQNFVKIGRCTAELLRICYFQNGDRPPSWIWHDVIADHPRLVFDGLNILLKLHFHRVNILRDIAIFTRATRYSIARYLLWKDGWLAGWVDGWHTPVLCQNAKPILNFFNHLVAPSF